MADPAPLQDPATPDRAAPEDCVLAMGYSVYNGNLATIPVRRPCSTIQTISPISYGNAVTDALYRDAMQRADWLCLDGVYFGLASLLLHGRITRGNQGPDIFYHFMQRLQDISGRAFFLGASEPTLAKMKARAARDYPRVEVGVYSPPFTPEFSVDENHKMVQAINEFRPDIVFLGMTAPKQEKWAYLHRDRLDAALVVSIGGVFDWFAGNRKEIAPIWWKLKLAWLVRMIDRPELVRRLPAVGIFFRHLVLARLGIRRHPEDVR
jgi:N-acetylglucosaminyldiphosphoundecaprenol N-acetyl-beta-D-mannosaminyltransferase